MNPLQPGLGNGLQLPQGQSQVQDWRPQQQQTQQSPQVESTRLYLMQQQLKLTQQLQQLQGAISSLPPNHGAGASHVLSNATNASSDHFGLRESGALPLNLNSSLTIDRLAGMAGGEAANVGISARCGRRESGQPLECDAPASCSLPFPNAILKGPPTLSVLSLSKESTPELSLFQQQSRLSSTPGSPNDILALQQQASLLEKTNIPNGAVDGFVQGSPGDAGGAIRQARVISTPWNQPAATSTR